MTRSPYLLKLQSHLTSLSWPISHIAEAVKPRRLFNAEASRVTPHIRKAYDGVLVAIRDGAADAITFGQLFIANPDLPQRFKENQSLNVPEVATIYSVGLHGYTDYPELSASR